jgi:CheY-like chemotaxis protein
MCPDTSFLRFCTNAQQADVQQESEDNMARKDPGYTVLIADDEPEVVDLVQIVLQTEGYKVQSASNGRKALDKITEQPPDLILLDVMMPEMTGLMLLEHLREDPTLSKIPVIMLSVVVTDPEVRMALEGGAIAYLSKPFEIRELVWLVNRALTMNAEQRDRFRQQCLKDVGRR